MIIERWLFVVILAASGCGTPAERRVSLESFKLQALNGDPVDWSAYRGKTIFINVWATWCKPCVQEMPTIAMAMKELDGRDVVFLFASSEDAEEIAAFRGRRPYPFDYFQLLNMEALAIDAIPATFIFDPSGNMVFGEEGFRDWSTPENLQLITQDKE